LAAALALAALAGAADAALYKWTDANGRVVYSDQPPPAGANVTPEVLRAPPPADPQAVKDFAAKEAEFKKRQTDRAEEAKKADKSRTEAARRADACVQLRGQIKLLSAGELVYRMNDKGERVYMDEAARRREAERLEAMLREQSCPPA
jgi:hypothetical protein